MGTVKTYTEGSPSERDAWLHIIKPSELDAHMASIGQAETNAAIVCEMFRRFPLVRNARLLIHGCGSCQMFDYLKPSELGEINVTFADVSPAMMEEGHKRVSSVPELRCEFVTDDIENSRLQGPFDAVLLVLVLLHVDWKPSLLNMMKLGVSRFYLIEQDQKAGVSPVTSEGELLPSMQRYSEVTEMELVPRQDLTSFMESHGFRELWTTTCPVLGEKQMTGFVFQSN